MTEKPTRDAHEAGAVEARGAEESAAEDKPRRRVFKLNRREWMLMAGGAGSAGALALGVGFYAGTLYEQRQRRVPPRPQPFSPNVFLAIDADGETTIWLTKSEMGQGVYTGLPLIVAEELGADWNRVRIQPAPASANYGSQFTAASSSVRSLYPDLRQAGAAARTMLERAAAETWAVPMEQCRVDRGAVEHRPSGRRLEFGELVMLASTFAVPNNPELKRREEFTLIGSGVRRLDTAPKINGRATYGLDVRGPSLRYAVLARPPGFGAELGGFDREAALAVEGVREVIEVLGAVAVVADNTWAALQGRSRLNLRWNEGPHHELSSERIRRELQEKTESDGVQARREGSARRAPRVVTARYELPFLAHQTMEPPNCTAQIAGRVCRVWAPTQDPQGVQRLAASVSGLPLGDCHVQVPFLGGGFGRRVQTKEVREALELAQRLSPDPVKVVWSREDDLAHDFYRPASSHRVEVGIEGNQVVSWKHVLAAAVSESRADRGEVDEYAVDGATTLPYAIDHVEIRYNDLVVPVPMGIWRSVSHSYNAFAVECALDEAALSVDADPLALRLDMLARRPRHRNVLRRVAEMCSWDTGPAAGRAFGLAVHACFGSVCAQVAEVTQHEGRPRVERVWAAVDCGIAIHPDSVRAQIEGAVIFGLSAALHGEVRIDAGRVTVSNFHDAPLLRLPQSPEIEVEIVEGNAEPGGVGEVGVPPIAPAVANALSRLRGERVRRLPLT